MLSLILPQGIGRLFLLLTFMTCFLTTGTPTLASLLEAGEQQPKYHRAGYKAHPSRFLRSLKYSNHVMMMS